MKGKISFLQMMTKKLFRIKINPRQPGQETGEDSVIQRQRDRVTKTTSLPPPRDSTIYTAPLKPFKKRKYHSQKVKNPSFDEFQLDNSNSKPRKKSTRRKFSLRNVGARGRLNESCPDFIFNFNDGVDAIDAVDVNTFQLFRNDISVPDVEFIEINFE